MYNGNGNTWTPQESSSGFGEILKKKKKNSNINTPDPISTDYTRYYDFYELNIGNTIIGSKPRKENMENTQIPIFKYLSNGSYNQTNHNVIMYTVPTYHDWTSAEYIESNVNRYPANDIDAPCKDMCHEILNSLSIAMMMSEISSRSVMQLTNQLEENATIPPSQIEQRN